MTGHGWVGRTAIRPQRIVLALVAIASTACSGGERLVTSEIPLAPIDTTPPPVDSVPTPTPPAPDTVAPPAPPPEPPPPPPPDTTGPGQPPYTPVHVGIPFGVSAVPMTMYSPVYNGAQQRGDPDSLLEELELARRANARLIIRFTGSAHQNRDAKGLSITKWKQRVDRYRHLDLSSYIADGTIIGHLVMDEPTDPHDWIKVVTREQIDELGKYSKEVWPTMAVIVRAWPEYLKGYQFKYVDATWAQYVARFGSIDEFIEKNVRESKELGLELVAGLNILGGGGEEGVSGYHGKSSMSAAQIRAWGTRYLTEPYICAFLMWKYHPRYLARPEIKAAIEELAEKARTYPNKKCQK